MTVKLHAQKNLSASLLLDALGSGLSS